MTTLTPRKRVLDVTKETFTEGTLCQALRIYFLIFHLPQKLPIFYERKLKYPVNIDH